MFYFFVNIIFYFILILFVYYYLSRKHISILDFLIMLFLLNVYFIFLSKDINLVVSILVTLIILLIRNLFQYLYSRKKVDMSDNNIFIKFGNINFKGLIRNNYSYQKLINNLRKKGFKNLNDIEYCGLYNNELVIFKNNFKTYPVSLIIDGKLIENSLKNINKNSLWLDEMLKINNLVIKDIEYAFYKDDKLYFLTNMSSS